MIWVPSAGLASLRRPSFPFLTLFSSIRYGASLSPRVLRLSSLSDLLFFAPPPLLSLPIMIHRHPVRIPLLGVIDSLLVFGGHFWSLWDTYRQISTGYRQGYPQSYGIVAPASSSEPPCQRESFWNVRWAYAPGRSILRTFTLTFPAQVAAFHCLKDREAGHTAYVHTCNRARSRCASIGVRIGLRIDAAYVRARSRCAWTHIADVPESILPHAIARV